MVIDTVMLNYVKVYPYVCQGCVELMFVDNK